MQVEALAANGPWPLSVVVHSNSVLAEVLDTDTDEGQERQKSRELKWMQ
jgi:hypothetical protein